VFAAVWLWHGLCVDCSICIRSVVVFKVSIACFIWFGLVGTVDILEVVVDFEWSLFLQSFHSFYFILLGYFVLLLLTDQIVEASQGVLLFDRTHVYQMFDVLLFRLGFARLDAVFFGSFRDRDRRRLLLF